jgi:hypothetical protein
MSQQPQQAPDDYDFDPEGRTENVWLARTLGREMFYEGTEPRAKNLKDHIDGPPRCFVIRRPGPKSIYGGVEFWMQVGIRTDGSLIGVPFYSGVPVQKWTYKDDRGNVRLSLRYPPKDDALADIVREHPELIVPKMFDGKMELWSDGSPKRNHAEVFAIEAYEVVFEFTETEVADPKNPGRTKKKKVYVNGPDGKAKYSINPTPWILKLRRPWWTQLKDRVLVPKTEEEHVAELTAGPDGTTAAPAKKKWAGKLPTTDISQVMLMFWAKTGDEPAKGAANVEYSIQFSERMTIDSSKIVPVDELPSRADGSVDWHQVFPPMTKDQAIDIVAKAEENADGGSGAPPPQAPPGGPQYDEHGQLIQGSPEGGGGDDDIPF